MSGPAVRLPVWRRDRSWRARAACLDADPDLFFPPQGDAARRAVAAAREICAACPVRAACRSTRSITRSRTACGAASRRRSGAARGAAGQRRRPGETVGGQAGTSIR